MPIWLAPMLLAVAETTLAALAVRLVDVVFAEGEPVAEPTAE